MGRDPEPTEDQELTVADGDAGQRLDRFLRKALPAVPLSALHRLLRQGAIQVDGGKAGPGLRLQAGTRIGFRGSARELPGSLRAPTEAAPPAPGRWRGGEPAVLFRDAHLLAVDKPPGMAVQPGDGRSLVDWLAARPDLLPPTTGRTFRPGPAHRLDRGTSGVVLVGLSPAGLRGLHAAFRAGEVRKTYLALVQGVPSPQRGRIDAPLRVLSTASADDAKVVVDPDGSAAVTHYRVVGRRGDDAVVLVRIDTGRTHQIRAHLAHLGHPLAGDRRYGGAGSARMLLHALRVELAHPVTGRALRITAPPPALLARDERRGQQ